MGCASMGLGCPPAPCNSRSEVLPMTQQKWLGIAMLAALVLTGCGRSTSPLQSAAGGSAPAGSDQSQVATVVQDNPQYVNEDAWQSDAATAFDGTGFAAIRPLRFWRTIASETRSDSIEFGAPDSTGRPTLARVTIHRELIGRFNILAGSTDASDTTKSLVHKPLDDLWTRHLLLRRGPDPRDGGRPRWRLVGTSGVDIHTRGGSTHLASLRIQSGSLDTTVTDPLELHRLARI